MGRCVRWCLNLMRSHKLGVTRAICLLVFDESIIHNTIQGRFVLCFYGLLSPLPVVYVGSIKPKEPTAFYPEIFVIHCNDDVSFLWHAVSKIGVNGLCCSSIQIKIIPIDVSTLCILECNSRLILDGREKYDHVLNVKAQIPSICNLESG